MTQNENGVTIMPEYIQNYLITLRRIKMTPNELEKYRIKLFRDAIGMKNKPERIPHMSFFVTWKILNYGCKLTEAMTDYELMEKIQYQFHEEYDFDGYLELGNRNNYMTSKIMQSPCYDIDDDNGSVNFRDFSFADHEELMEYAENPNKFIWEKAMVKKYPYWAQGVDTERIQNAIDANAAYGQYAFGIMLKMREKYGIPFNSNYKGFPQVPAEPICLYARGIKGLSIDMRRDKQYMLDVMEKLAQSCFYPELEKMKTFNEGADMSSIFDTEIVLMAQNMMNPSQWDMFYWPYLKQVLDLISKKKWSVRFFTEGAASRFWDYLKDYPKGTIAAHLENDDVYMLRKKLPNVAIIGGLTTALLGKGTKDECLDATKKLIDELGANGGFVLSQDKMASYRSDCNADNLKAVCELVHTYRV